MTTIRMTITVTYDNATVEDPEQLRRHLRKSIDRKIIVGDLLDGPDDSDGNGGPIVDDYELEVERTH